MTEYGKLTYPEISEQNEALQAAWEELNKQLEWVNGYFANPAYKEVIFIGSGSSYYQAQIMASAFRKWLGRSAIAMPSSEIMLFRENVSSSPDKKLLVGVSRSGESSEVILALESVKSLPEWDICGVTCHADSKMAQISPCLVSPKGAEKSTVMTKSFSSMTYMILAAIALASSNEEYKKQVEAALSAQAPVVKAADAFAKSFVDQHDVFVNYIYLGMGPLFGVAEEAGLKIKEMANVWTESYGTLEFRHGPKSIIVDGSLVILLLSEAARAHELKVGQEMQGYGAKVLVVTTEKGEDTAFADYVFEIGGKDLSDDARSVLCLPLLQYLGFYTALKKGVNPDQPRNLTQVVKID